MKQNIYRYIAANKEIYWFPSNTANTSIEETTITGNTLAQVLFAGYYEENNIWLFMVIPTFDTPTNNRRWIREIDTEKYTKKILKNIEAGIIIKKGVIGYQDNGVKDVAEQDRTGGIGKRENGKVLVGFAGGQEIWYDEKDISYPDSPPNE